MHKTFVCFAIISISGTSYSEETSCLQSEKLFADLCFNPKPLMDINAPKFLALQPSDGWHVELANDVTRLHFAESVKGKLLKQEDITDDLCPRLKVEHGDDSHNSDGEYFGFGNLYANFTCKGSKDFPTVLRCTLENSKGSKYTEQLMVYISYLSPKGVFAFVHCYQNGEVGWHTAAVSNKMTTEDEQAVKNHVKSIGFPDETTFSMWPESCK